MSDKLSNHGAYVKKYYIYQRIEANWSKNTLKFLLVLERRKIFPTWLITSSESIFSVANILNRIELISWWSQCSFVVIHPKLNKCLINILGKLSKVFICLPTEQSIFDTFSKIQNNCGKYKN
ncbi:MAG: hypothetical protein IR526_02450 [Bordetella sp.]|nr:MAG: hypothetical protein IR526_02450 [Bordetella sp.]